MFKCMAMQIMIWFRCDSLLKSRYASVFFSFFSVFLPMYSSVLYVNVLVVGICDM